MEVFRELHEGGRTIVLVTHDPAIAAHCDRVARLEAGRIVTDGEPSSDDDTRGSGS
jgi:predicted ABC-type transport system involved in lysophospholipase L1 biosynthesis ATPase subunit